MEKVCAEGAGGKVSCGWTHAALLRLKTDEGNKGAGQHSEQSSAHQIASNIGTLISTSPLLSMSLLTNIPRSPRRVSIATLTCQARAAAVVSRMRQLVALGRCG